MLGPAKGHNVKRFFDYFQGSEEHSLSYLYFNAPEHYDLASYDRIHWIPHTRPLAFLKALRSVPDLIWVHNWTPVPILFFILLFRKRSSPINFNVWSEPIPRTARSKTLKGRFYRYFFRKCRTVQCTWYGTFDLLKDLKGIHPVLLRWGMVEDWFQSTDPALAEEETRNFLNSLPRERTRFFFPKSLSPGNRHDLLVEASRNILERGMDEFVVYFWLGNHNPPELLEEVQGRIESEGVEDHVRIVEHSFLPDHDMKLIWEHMDAGLQILDMDQLSTSLQEPMLLKKELIASDLSPYRRFEEEFGVDLNLIPNEAERIAERMEAVVRGERTDPEELNKREKVLWDHYRFDENMERMLEHFRDPQKVS